MDKNIAIEFRHVSKIYSLKSKEKKDANKKFYALKDINFQIPKGEVVGVLGTNGSGKSTMSLVLSGIATPNEGEIEVNGSLALIAIQSGMNMQLTGIENIRYKAALLGFSKQRTQEMIDGVIEFAELGDFLYQPIKKYSSGMRARLGFSINLCLNPDIMIVDEALSVGDRAFARKCLKKMNELKEQGKTIVFISHSLPQVREFCTQILWIEGGMLVDYGEVTELCDRYEEYVGYLNDLKPREKKKVLDEKFQKRIIADAKPDSVVDIFMSKINNRINK